MKTNSSHFDNFATQLGQMLTKTLFRVHFSPQKSILNTRNYIPPFNIQNMWIRWLEADHFSCNMFLVIDLAVHITQSDQGL